MKKIILIVFIIIQILVSSFSVCAADIKASNNYSLYYPEFVESNVPLEELQKDDLKGWDETDEVAVAHPLLSAIPNPNRVDYFDISYGKDPLQKLDIYHMKGNELKPVIFFIYGGGFAIGDKNYSRYAAPTWIELGYTVVSINYRRTPNAVHPAQIEDAVMALKWVTNNIYRYGGDPNRIAIIGHSSGAYLTAMIATSTKFQQKYNIDINRVKCWIPMGGIYDYKLPENFYHPMLVEFLNPYLVDADKIEASPITYVTGNEPPCLLLHGADDWLVPKSNTIEFYNKLVEKGVDVQMELVKNYRHSDMLIKFGEIGHQPTKIIDDYLKKYLPSDKNR